jgi:hypothetical protein
MELQALGRNLPLHMGGYFHRCLPKGSLHSGRFVANQTLNVTFGIP